MTQTLQTIAVPIVKMIRFIITIVLVFLSTFAKAEVVSVEYPEKGLVVSDIPTLNFVWPSKQAKATLIFIPGGEGRLGIMPDRANLGGFYGATLKPLSDDKVSSGALNVVVFDSPVNLPVGTEYPYSRQSREHLLRIESVVRHFKELYGLPIWLMGHSNGAVSITEFYKMLQKSGNENLVAGAIYSSARNGADFAENTKLPILFLAHERDACEKSLPFRSKAVFERQIKTNPMKLKYVLIQGGEAQAQHPCSSGFHMFYGAGQEAYSAIDNFVFDRSSTK
jgi:hypothetical protein